MLKQKSARPWTRLLNLIMSIIIRKIMKFGMYIFYIGVKPYSLYYNYKISRKKVPPITNKLLKIPALKLAEMIRNQEVKCEDVIQAYVDRCREVNPLLNAIVEDRFEEALKEARIVDSQIQSGFKTVQEMKAETPLLGLPLTVKESIQVEGMSNQAGRVYKKKKIALEDAPIIKNARKRGAIILCVTNTPELCLSWETHNKVSGTTLNPYDLKRTPGGSSGGEAALLGSGASLISLGTDIAGSCRLPPMFVGVYGHKPTPFVCSPHGHNPGSDDPRWGLHFTTAPMARYSEDLLLLLDAVKDDDGPKIDLLKEVSVKNINFYFMDDNGSGMTQPLSPCIKKSILAVASHFNAKEVKLSLFKHSLDISINTMLPIPFDTIYAKPGEGEERKTSGKEFLKYLVGQSDSIFSSVIMSTFQYVARNIPKARKRQLDNIQLRLREDLLTLLGDNGVLLYPTAPRSANKHYEVYYNLLDPSYMMVFNTLGFPVTQVKTGMDKHNLPIGIQVVTAPLNDRLSLAVAREIEKVFGGWVERPVEDQ